MKKILAVLAVLCMMALPAAGLAEEAAAETPMSTQLMYSLENINLSINGQALDFTGYAYNAVLTVNPDGSFLESTSNLVNDQLAMGGVALMDAGVLTVALRGVNGDFVTPAITLNVNELMEQYSKMLAGQNGGADIETMINQYMAKAMGVMGIVMTKLNQLEPDQIVIEKYPFVDGVECDINANTYTLDPDTLNGIAADVTEALGVETPVSFDGITLTVTGGSSADGRNAFSMLLSNGEQSYAFDVQAFDANGGKTFYVCVFADDNAIADLLARYTLDDNVFSAELKASAADASFEFGINGLIESLSFDGTINCSLQAQNSSVSFFGDVFAAIDQVEYTDAGAELKALESVDLMALSQDEDSANALIQKWAPFLTESLTLLRQVPAFDMLFQAYNIPAGETVAE